MKMAIYLLLEAVNIMNMLSRSMTRNFKREQFTEKRSAEKLRTKA